MAKDVDPLPSQGALDLYKAGNKFTAESKSLLDCPAVADQPLLLRSELFVEGLVYGLEDVSTTDPVGVLDVHLPTERLAFKCDNHLGHSAIGRGFVQLGFGQFHPTTRVLEDNIIHRKGHIKAKESLRSAWIKGKQLPMQIERGLFHGHCHQY